jgi:dienelactone hydrolase
VRFQELAVAGVPLLLAAEESASGPLPLVLWFHGLGAGKDVHRPELERVARAGFLAVGVDAAGHGARRRPDLDALIAAPLEDARAAMLELADATVAEVPAIVGGLVDAGRVDGGRVAAVGISMGGYLLYRALASVPAIRTAVALLGSPEWPDAASPHRRLAALRPVALLSITAECDASVPPAAARRLHDSLAPTHPDPGRLRYVELPGAQHLVSAAEWEQAMAETVGWLVRHALQGAARDRGRGPA